MGNATVCTLRRARGQAATELVVAMLVVVPLLTGLLTLAGLLDLQAALHRTSGMAAFQQALAQPRGRAPGDVEQQAARERLFDAEPDRAGVRRKRGEPAPDPTTWRDAAGARLLPGGDAVSVRFAAQPVGGAAAAVTQALANGLGLPRAQRDSVEVAARPQLGDGAGPLQDLAVSVSSTTALAGAGWAAGGAADVRDRVRSATVGGALGSTFTEAVDLVGSLLVGVLESVPGPQLGCVQPDAVPSDRLSRSTAPVECRN